MPEKCHKNNSDDPLTTRRTDGGKNKFLAMAGRTNSYKGVTRE